MQNSWHTYKEWKELLEKNLRITQIDDFESQFEGESDYLKELHNQYID
jgi:hypothetical protein